MAMVVTQNKLAMVCLRWLVAGWFVYTEIDYLDHFFVFSGGHHHGSSRTSFAYSGSGSSDGSFIINKHTLGHNHRAQPIGLPVNAEKPKSSENQTLHKINEKTREMGNE